MSAPLFFFDHPDNKTDVFMGGDIDSSLMELTKKMGWWEELKKMGGEEEEKTEEKEEEETVEKEEGANGSNSRLCKTKK